MKVFVTGSRGFIGRHLVERLLGAGHDVVYGVSSRDCGDSPTARVVVDFVRDVQTSTWLPRLEGVDCVVNTVGAIGGGLDAIHVDVPTALFAAAAQGKVQVINVSALGADEGAQTAFHRTKKKADDELLATHPFATVVQPSLVYGEGGASARMLTVLASLPVVPLPGSGMQRVQPIHVDDVAAAIVALLDNRAYAGRKIALVGPVPLTMRTFLAELRAALGLGRPRFLPVPDVLMSLAASLGTSLVNGDMLSMLERGNTADASDTREILGRDPRGVSAFIPPAARAALVTEAKLEWLLVLLRVSIAVVWVTAGVLSAGIYPLSESLALVGRMGITGGLALALVYAGAVLDVVLGIATLVLTGARWLWALQMVVIAGYTLMISIWLPEFWLHPYGPIVKNLPMLCALFMLYELDGSKPTRR